MNAGLSLSGRTRLTAIFGDPVEHSLSPAMHNRAYATLGMDRAYVAFRVAPADLPAAVRAIPPLGILGVNLTVPHKEAAVALMDTLSAEAQLLGAINCVVNRDGRLHGDNTDARGLEQDLREAGLDLAGKRALIIGAGGAAASAILAVIRLGAEAIALCNRTLGRAQELARRFEHYVGDARRATRLEVAGLQALTIPATWASCALVINATSLGLGGDPFPPLAYEATPSDCCFYDLIYARAPTPFLAPALAMGRVARDGAGMLANQGALAFELFNGIAPPRGLMRATLMAALGRST
ncbi:MAG TPA: shikimate dehydrogenase [Candidatus Binataceae bacterium]|nr:shikimate dehydrogenase [Candidatus Binataceae bacterium]